MGLLFVVWKLESIMYVGTYAYYAHYYRRRRTMMSCLCVCVEMEKEKKFLGGEIYYVRHPFQLHPIKSKYTPSAVLYTYIIL